MAAVIAAGPFVIRAGFGQWPSARYLLSLAAPLAWALARAQLWRSLRRPVSRRQLEEYERWRSETELTSEERAIPLPRELPSD
jgi:hypothetical protein